MCDDAIVAMHSQFEVIDIGPSIGMWQLFARRIEDMKDKEQ